MAGYRKKSSPPEEEPEQNCTMMDILAYAGAVSGIDEALRLAARGKDSAQMMISAVRYLAADENRCLADIFVWQMSHPLPYTAGFDENFCQKLSGSLNWSGDTARDFFRSRHEHLQPRGYTVFSASVESRRRKEPYEEPPVRDRYLCLCSAETLQPAACVRLPGCTDAAEAMELLDLEEGELVLDPEFSTDRNAGALLKNGMHFLMDAGLTEPWVREAVESAREQLLDISSQCPSDSALHGCTAEVEHSFPHTILEGGAEKTEQVAARVYLHIFYDGAAAWSMQTDFEADIREVRDILVRERTLLALSTEAREKAAKYLILERDGEGRLTAVNFNTAACRERCARFGLQVLLSDRETDPFQALEKYRIRGETEAWLQEGCWDREWKEHLDPGILDARMFLQFAALCLRSFFAGMVSEAEQKLEENMARETGETRFRTRMLLSWMRDRSPWRILLWFDARRPPGPLVGFQARRWSPETLKRDRLLLQALGVLPGQGETAGGPPAPRG